MSIYLPAFLLCFFLLLIVVVFYKGPKSWDEIEKEDREKATRKGLTYAAWLEARAKKKARAIPKAIRRAVFARDNYQCVHCGAQKALTLDHIFPFSKGGSNDLENLQVLCKACNFKKANLLPKGRNQIKEK